MDKINEDELIKYIEEEFEHARYHDTPYNSVLRVACIEDHPLGLINGYIGSSPGFKGALKRSVRLNFEPSEDYMTVRYIPTGKIYNVTYRCEHSSDVRDWMSEEYRKRKEMN